MEEVVRLALRQLATPFGDFTLVASAAQLLLVLLPGEPETRLQAHLQRRVGRWAPGGGSAVAEAAARQLDEYCAGRRTRFELPLAGGGTEFEQAVWAAVAAIPYGETTTYGALAAALGRPGAARAVGRANGANPLPVVVPCHRVVGGDGSMRGYAGGVPLKQALLDHERRHSLDEGAVELVVHGGERPAAPA